jgi:ribosomal protein S18 acetylase RimI-like enzyme
MDPKASKDAAKGCEVPVMIRPTTAADTPLLLKLTQGTGVFKPHEVEALDEVLADYHAGSHAEGHIAVTDERHGQVVGYAYYAPAAMTDRTWYLYWIAVTRSTQAKGVGSGLLRHAEEDIRKHKGRVLFIETSSLPHYELTRKFYLKHGYEIAAVLKDYYSDGDDMIVFCKRLES